MTVTPVKLREPDALLHVDRLRVIGYRGSCSRCAWIGKVRCSVALARQDEYEHVCGPAAA